MTTDYAPGDEWEDHYRGYRLQTNPDGEVWWQVYQGTDRLYLEPTPTDLVDTLLKAKRLGGRIRITEGTDVLTRRESDDGYEQLWLGTVDLDCQLVPEGAEEFSIEVRPTGLESGDLWPSVYDGAKYSFGPGAERFWWQNSETHKKHPVTTDLSESVVSSLASLKPQGGSFRVTPWNDVITLVDTDRASAAREQIRDLPRVVKNIIRLRKERGVEKLPVYVGSLRRTPLEVTDPPSLTDSLSEDEQEELESWAASLGSTSTTTPDEHTADLPADDPTDW
jgi:hypothetical protein